ncbi:exopolysaccharide biosynthesis protein [Desulfitobacterium sp. LBE]|uniref:M56 family metallopeptidase n=1 Tax=Desulfitobacterium sp. LBE TaxID=884086 RepID=UPI00119A5FB3|nr:M56 family metallopeptidase [Desulfitobacterium sp. LBE]TWH55931.1 exopolysaccharide biosynthesis protein [Desulfitobacterium sp. LBE]
MIETVMTSSVLILIVVALRQLLRGRISSRLQYALWLLVAIRLLLPFSLFESPISVLNALPKQPGGFVTVVPTTIPNPAALVTSADPAVPADPANPVNPVNPAKGIEPIGIQTAQNNNTVTNAAAHKTDYGAMATYLWLGGILTSGGVVVMANVRLSRKLRRSRQRVHNVSCPLAVYVTEDLPSPCLYGLWKPSIYLTPPSLADEQRTTHVIAHELTHYRHGDHIWSLVRVLCFCIHWFNPLVWLAVVLSRQDSELACDEGTLRVLGEKNRLAYGKTLIEMMTVSPKPTELFYCATTMTGGKGEITERIKRIAQKPRMLRITLIGVLLIAAVSIAVTFGGGYSETTAKEVGLAEDLWKSRTEYLGDNSAVGKLIGLLPVPEGVQYDHFKLHTGEQPYDIEIIYSVSAEVLKQYDTEETRQANPFRQNALILLALVDNAGGIRATLTDGQREVGFINGREWADYAVGEDVRNYAESPEKLGELMDFSFTSGTATQIRTPIEGGTLVYDSSGILIEDIEGKDARGDIFFRGKVMLISDPKRVKVAVTQEIGTAGEKLTDMVSRSGAIAGINAGGVYDPNGEGNGAIPYGITVQNGEVVYDTIRDEAVDFVGLDAEGKLIIGTMNVAEIKEKNIQEGVGFSSPLYNMGTPLVRNGQPAVSGNGGWGIAPRTGIGQRADGTLILLVIDGRDPDWSIGATLRNMANVFLEYGAVEAVNLDGGSMVEMVYEGRVLNKLRNIFGERPIPTGFVVMP